MSIFGKMQKKRWVRRLSVYVIDAAIVLVAAFCSLLMMTWGADFRFIEHGAVWIWMCANVLM